MGAVRVSLTPRFSGVSALLVLVEPLQRFRGRWPCERHRKTAEAVQLTRPRARTPLKRGVNETGPRLVCSSPYTFYRQSHEDPSL